MSFRGSPASRGNPRPKIFRFCGNHLYCWNLLGNGLPRRANALLAMTRFFDSLTKPPFNKGGLVRISAQLGHIHKFDHIAVRGIGLENNDLIFAGAKHGGGAVEGLLGACVIVVPAQVEAVDRDEAVVEAI